MPCPLKSNGPTLALESLSSFEHKNELFWVRKKRAGGQIQFKSKGLHVIRW